MHLYIYYLVVFVYKFFVFPLSAVNIAANITPTKNANTIVIPTTSDIPLGR